MAYRKSAPKRTRKSSRSGTTRRARTGGARRRTSARGARNSTQTVRVVIDYAGQSPSQPDPMIQPVGPRKGRF